MDQKQKASIARVEQYLAERARMSGHHQELIHGLHEGDHREANLLVSDLKAILAMVRASSPSTNA